MSHHKLKTLQVQRSKLLEQKKTLSREMSAIDHQIRDIDEEIDSLTIKEPVITEHALLRYIAAVADLDLEEVKETLLNDKVKDQIHALKSGKFPIGDGMRAVVKNNTIVTVLPKDE